MNTKSILAQFKEERQKLDDAIAALEALQGSRHGRVKASNGRKGKRKVRKQMSAAARKRISQAQKRRWAAQKKSA